MAAIVVNIRVRRGFGVRGLTEALLHSRRLLLSILREAPFPLTPKPLLTRIFTIVAAMFYGEFSHDFLIGDCSLPREDAFLLRDISTHQSYQSN